jgi:hypothetical protein
MLLTAGIGILAYKISRCDMPGRTAMLNMKSGHPPSLEHCTYSRKPISILSCDFYSHLDAKNILLITGQVQNPQPRCMRTG